MTEATHPNASAPTGQATSEPDLTGRTLGDYHVLRRLGRGGMGEVYLAEQRSLKRKVALKILRGELAANPIALKRFKYEAEAVAKATHANIVQVYVCEEVDGITYMALEYVEGRNLKEFFTKKGPPEPLLALSFMRQIAAALQRASELGIIHRDIKPENILLTRKGEVKVADFGLSRVLDSEQPAVNLTRTGMTLGTPLYMAPEQIEGKAVDPRTDIYSFGVTCYHMLAGVPPFTGSTAFEVVLAHVRTEPEPLQSLRPDLPETLCAVIHKMMAKDPAERYQTCRELLKDLSKVRDSLAGVTTGLKADDLGLAVSALDNLEEVTPPTPVKVKKARKTSSSPAMAQRGWLMLAGGAIVVGFLFIMLTAGAVLAWMHFASRDKPTNPSGSPTADGSSNTPKREQQLRDAAESYLTGQSGGKNTSDALDAFIDLSDFYLTQSKLSEAEKFFTRLENNRDVDSYHFLGRLGNGIVLALNNKAQDANAVFKDLLSEKRGGPDSDKGGRFELPGRRPGGLGGGKKPDSRPEPRADSHTAILQNSHIHYWLGQAVDKMKQGGVPQHEIPQALR